MISMKDLISKSGITTSPPRMASTGTETERTTTSRNEKWIMTTGIAIKTRTSNGRRNSGTPMISSKMSMIPTSIINLGFSGL